MKQGGMKFFTTTTSIILLIFSATLLSLASADWPKKDVDLVEQK